MYRAGAHRGTIARIFETTAPDPTCVEAVQAVTSTLSIVRRCTMCGAEVHPCGSHGCTNRSGSGSSAAPACIEAIEDHASTHAFVRLVHTVLSGVHRGTIARMYETVRVQTPACVVAIPGRRLYTQLRAPVHDVPSGKCIGTGSLNV